MIDTDEPRERWYNGFTEIPVSKVCLCTLMKGVDALPGMEPVRHSRPLANCPVCKGTGRII